MLDEQHHWSRDSPYVWVLRDASGRRTAGYCIRWLSGEQYCGVWQGEAIALAGLRVAQRAVEMRAGETAR